MFIWRFVYKEKIKNMDTRSYIFHPVARILDSRFSSWFQVLDPEICALDLDSWYQNTDPGVRC